MPTCRKISPICRLLGRLTIMPSAPFGLCSQIRGQRFSKRGVGHAGHGDQKVTFKVLKRNTAHSGSIKVNPPDSKPDLWPSGDSGAFYSRRLSSYYLLAAITYPGGCPTIDCPARQLLLALLLCPVGTSSCIHAVVRRQLIDLKIRFRSLNSSLFASQNRVFYLQFSAFLATGAILGQPPSHLVNLSSRDPRA